MASMGKRERAACVAGRERHAGSHGVRTPGRD